MFKVNKYVNGEYNFPNSNINPKLKTEEPYCMDYTKALFSLYQKNATSWGVNTLEYFDNMRRYANGDQDNYQYLSFIKNGDTEDDSAIPTIYDDNASFTKEFKRKGLGTIMTQNLSPATKILNSIHGMLDKLDYDIMADTIDADSRGLVEFTKYKKYHEAKDIAFQMEFKKKAGLPVDQPTNFPKTKEELDAFEAKEGFKLNVAKAMQKLVRHSFNISHWDTVTRKKVIDDLITTGYGVVMDFFDEETQTFQTKWLDPKYAGIQFSNETDYSDSEYGYYMDTMTISNLRAKLPELTDEEIVSLAKNNTGRFENPKRWNERYSKLDKTTNSYGCDSFKVCVFKSFWIDTDSHKSIYWKGKGSERVIDIGYDSKVKELTDGQKIRGFKQNIKKTSVRQVYQCSWIVDSDICFDYGKYHMAPRPEMTQPKIPIHAEQLLQHSIVYNLVPIFDHIAITWLQFQNDLANMVQRGYAINMAMLMNVQMNGKDLDPASVLTMWKQKGLLPYMLSMNGNYQGGMALPITPIEGGLGKRVEETSTAFEFYYRQIENTVGINPLALGASPDPNAPVSTSEAALRATSNVLKPIIDATFELKESLAESLCLRIQIGLRVSDKIRKSYAGVVSPNDIRAMMMAEQSNVKYGISLRARPDEKQRAMVMNFMGIAIQAGQITPVEAMYFSERIESGADITEVRQEIDYAIQKNKEQAQQEKMAMIDQQNKGLMGIQQQKDDNAAKQSVLETQGKVVQEQTRGQNKQKNILMEANIDFLMQLREAADAEAGILTNTKSR